MKLTDDSQFGLDGLRLCRVQLPVSDLDKRVAIKKALANYRSHFIDDSDHTGIKFFSTVHEATRIKEHFALEIFDAEQGKWEVL